jgi:hypothetical protein
VVSLIKPLLITKQQENPSIKMPLAILIVFKYAGSKELTSAPLDAEKMRNYLARFDCRLISDFSPEFSVENYPFTNFKDFIFVLENLVASATEIFFYYSGHADEGRIHLPDGGFISSSTITQILKNGLLPHSRVLSVFDCCYGFVLELPFEIKDGKMVHQGGVFMSPLIISINHTDKNIRAEMKKSGSSFTNEIVTWDLTKYICLDRLPVRTIRSTYPGLTFLLGKV